MNLNIKKITLISILISQAIILGYFERFMPINFIVPGAKLGLANIVTLISLFLLTFKETSFIMISRVILLSFMFGSLPGIVYGLAGGMLALTAMYLAIRMGKISIIGVSIIGAVFHNIGQLIVAAIIINNINIFYYLPLLLLMAIPTGIFIGFTSKFLLKYLKTTNLIKNGNVEVFK